MAAEPGPRLEIRHLPKSDNSIFLLRKKCENRFIRRTDSELGLACPAMIRFGEELSDEEIIFERNFKVTRSEKEPSTPQSNSSSNSAPHPKSLLTT